MDDLSYHATSHTRWAAGDCRTTTEKSSFHKFQLFIDAFIDALLQTVTDSWQQHPDIFLNSYMTQQVLKLWEKVRFLFAEWISAPFSPAHLSCAVLLPPPPSWHPSRSPEHVLEEVTVQSDNRNSHYLLVHNGRYQIPVKGSLQWTHAHKLLVSSCLISSAA